jgi:hypothetical protein
MRKTGRVRVAAVDNSSLVWWGETELFALPERNGSWYSTDVRVTVGYIHQSRAKFSDQARPIVMTDFS